MSKHPALNPALNPTLTRRNVLRGAAGIGLALPFLEALVRPQKASGAPNGKRTRLVVWYTSTGTILANWRPNRVGQAFDPSPILAPLLTPKLKPYVTVLSGVRMAAAEVLQGNAHAKGMASMLTGLPFTEVMNTQFGDVGWGGGISIDQLIANKLAEPGKLKSIETGVLNYSGDVTQYMSYANKGQGGIVPSEPDPRKVFGRLFANVPDTAAAKAELERQVKQRKSILDLVSADFKRLNNKVGAQDRERLEKHAALVRELEIRTQVSGGFCDKPAVPNITDGQIFNQNRITETGKLQMDMIRAGLACDLTRVATLQWSAGQSGVDFKPIIKTAPWDRVTCPPDIDSCSDGANTAQHTISHICPGTVGGFPTLTDPQRYAMECLTAISKYYSEQLATFATMLADTPDPQGGSLLDNTVILCVTECAEGSTHAYTDMPLLLVGGGGGKLKPGHYDFKNTRSMNDLFVTVAQTMGLDDVTTFGGPQFVKGPLSELWV
jgi:Protein of unknown function (DUF1552)